MRAWCWTVALAGAALLPVRGQYNNQYTGPVRRYLMDPGWKFRLGDPPGAESPRFGDSAWSEVDLPHDWSIHGSWKKDNPSGSAGGYADIGIGWYRKSFAAPATLRGRQVYLDFEGVFNHADVWINGQQVAHHAYGYMGFSCDLTPWIRPGRKNLIAVRVDNLKQASRWYTGSGLFRHVWLYATGAVHIAGHGTYVTTPSVSAARAQVRVAATLTNDQDTAATVAVETDLFDPSGRPAGKGTLSIRLPARGDTTVVQEISVDRPQLWDLSSPRLYRAVTKIAEDTAAGDAYQTSFGIRTIRWDVSDGFELNGKRVIIKGVCLHHDLGALGAAAYDQAIKRRLLILKSMGVNAVRLSHNPYSPAMLDWCDRLGLLVFDECFDKWYGFYPDGRGWKQTLTAFVKRDRNHPSVIIWSVGNEMTPHMYTHWGTRIFRAMRDVVHAYDPRPVTAALHPVRTGSGERDAPLAEIASYMDVISMNYQTRFYPRDHLQHPHQVLLGSETHVNQRNLGAPGAPNDGSGNQWFGTRDYRTGRYVSYVAGQFIWAGFDYLGEAGSWPSKGSRKNLIETTGFRKPFSYYIQSLYTDSPLVRIAVADPAFSADRQKYVGSDWLALASHWDWKPQYDSLRVYVFTNQPEAVLTLNGQSLGVKKQSDFPEKILYWEVPNRPGVLRASALSRGKTVATHTLETPERPARLLLTADRDSLAADGEDLSHIEVRLVDASGRRVPETGRMVRFTITGPGTIAGVDNGDLDSPEAFQAKERTLQKGRCLVIVRTLRQAGTIRVQARADGLPESSLVIPVSPSAGPPVW